MKNQPSGNIIIKDSAPTNIKKRERFEAILDNCSSSQTLLKCTEFMLDVTENGQVYNSARMVYPVQIGIEATRRLYPKMVEDILFNSSRNNEKKRFYERNQPRIHIADTKVAKAYRLFFSKGAIKILNDSNGLEEKILNSANNIYMDIYGRGKEPESIDFKKKLNELIEITNDVFKSFTQGLKVLEENINVAIYNGSIKLPEGLDEEDLNKIKDIILHDAVEKNFSRSAKEFDNRISDKGKSLLQAMYSNESLFKMVSKHIVTEYKERGFTKSLRNYSKDKGERGIESYLLDERDKEDFGVATITVSRDQKAIKRIQNLRRKTHNTILALTEEEMVLATKYLMDENPALAKSDKYKQLAKEIGLQAEKIISSYERKPKEFPVDPRKWAHRAYQTITNGKYEKGIEPGVKEREI